jgi:restriction system protein
MKQVRCAELDPEVFDALAFDFRNRFRVLQVLIQSYDLPRDRTGYLWDLLNTDEAAPIAPVAADAVGVSERAVEEHLESHWHATEFARLGIELSVEEKHGFPCRQVLTPRNTIDLLGYRADAREWWVFELKKGRSSDAVVGQVGRYMTWVLDQAKANQSVKGAIIVGRVDENLKASVRSNDKLTLWQYDQQLAVHRVPLN